MLIQREEETMSNPQCAEHGEALVWEPGGHDMPTVRGRWYCPSCQALFMAALDQSP